MCSLQHLAFDLPVPHIMQLVVWQEIHAAPPKVGPFTHCGTQVNSISEPMLVVPRVQIVDCLAPCSDIRLGKIGATGGLEEA